MTDITLADAKPLLLYSEITRNIMVMVQPEYLPQNSKPEENYFFWVYHVTIENGGTETIQLVRRNWTIVDDRGQVMEVSGEGVIGRQPILRSGERFEYTSGTPLTAPSGMMTGTYIMRTGNGEEFPVTIPTFSLDSLEMDRVVH